MDSEEHPLDKVSSENSNMSYSIHEQLTASIKIQRQYAVPLYQEVWPDSDIFENDDESNQGEHSQNVRNLLSMLDYSGIDKIIKIQGRGGIHISQRFRSLNNKGFDIDFSLRTHTAHGNESEYYKLIENRQSVEFNIPSLYGFGIVNGYSVMDGVDNGLLYFAIFKLRPIIDDLIEENISYNHHKNVNDGDSSGAIYISRNQIKKYIYKDAEWGIRYPTNENYKNLQSISDQKQSEMKQIGLKDFK